MRLRTKITAGAVALLVVAAVTLVLLPESGQAQLGPGLSVAGVILGGTSATNSTPGPVPPCYKSAGTACDGTSHVVTDHTTQSLFANCASNQTCDFTLNNPYITITLSGAAAFSNSNYSCSAAIWTSSTGYVGYCQPASSSALNIYMYNPTSSTVTSGTTVSISYSASGS